MTTAKNTDITATAKETLADVQTRAKTASPRPACSPRSDRIHQGERRSCRRKRQDLLRRRAGTAQGQRRNRQDRDRNRHRRRQEGRRREVADRLMQLQAEIARRNFDALVSSARSAPKPG
jgi:hypothetical protein